MLKGFLENLQIPVLEHLRDSPAYGLAAEQGLGVCELPQPQSRAARPGWQAILNWIEGGTAPLAARAAEAAAAQVTPVVPQFLAPVGEAAVYRTPQKLN